MAIPTAGSGASSRLRRVRDERAGTEPVREFRRRERLPRLLPLGVDDHRPVHARQELHVVDLGATRAEFERADRRAGPRVDDRDPAKEPGMTLLDRQAAKDMLLTDCAHA